MTIHLLGHIEKFKNHNNGVINGDCQDKDSLQINNMNNNKQFQTKPYKRRFMWRNIIILTYLHAVAVYSAIFISHCKWQVSLFGESGCIHKVAKENLMKKKTFPLPTDFFVGCCAALGITAGAHRLWTHKCI